MGHIHTTFVTWYKPAPSWGAWVARLALSKLDKWKTLGIGEAIRASKYEMPINLSLLTSFLCFWSPVTNNFSFPEGFMTPTVFDVFALLSLCPMGVLAHPLMAVGTGPNDDILNGVPLSYNDFIKHMKGANVSPVSYKEECCFYLLWICKFLACTSSKRVINYYLPIARCLVNGIPVDMSLFLLGELYRAMFLLNTEPKQSHGGPVWLIQMWAYSYFPRLLLSFILPSCHGLMEKLGCMPGFLKKKESLPSLHASSFSTTHRGGGYLKSSCLSRQRSMVLRTSNSSQAKASSEETRHGVLVSNRGTWWLLGPPMLVLKHTALR